MLSIGSFHPILILVWLVINMAINYLSTLPPEYQISSINKLWGRLQQMFARAAPLSSRFHSPCAVFRTLPSSMCQSLLRFAFLVVAKMTAAVLIHIYKNMRPPAREGLSSSNHQANVLCFTDVRPTQVMSLPELIPVVREQGQACHFPTRMRGAGCIGNELVLATLPSLPGT